MVDNINNIKFSDFTLDYNSLLYSGIATATTAPRFFDTLKKYNNLRGTKKHWKIS